MIASIRASGILRRVATTPRSRILANAAEALFPTDEKRTPLRSHPLPCKCNYYRFKRTRGSRKKDSIFIRYARPAKKTDFQLIDVTRSNGCKRRQHILFTLKSILKIYYSCFSVLSCINIMFVYKYIPSNFTTVCKFIKNRFVKNRYKKEKETRTF